MAQLRGSLSKKVRSSSSDASSGWMWQSQTLAMSLLDEDHSEDLKRKEEDSFSDKNRDGDPHDVEQRRESLSGPNVYRLVDRLSKFKQAKYPITVQRVLPLEEVFQLFYAKDPVLALTNLSTIKGFMVMMLFFIISCAVTALPWWAMGEQDSYVNECSVETTSFQRAFIFSSQVIMTIGFGTKDIFFGDCIIPTIVLTLHCCVSLLVQSLIMGVIYQRLSRATSRRHTVVYSDNAVIRRIRGRLYFMVQVSELRAMQLVEAHVRMYMIRHEAMLDKGDDDSTDDVIFTQTYAMRLSQPNDDLGSKILLTTPQILVHEIDEYSPIRPPQQWVEEQKPSTPLPPRSSRAHTSFGKFMQDSDTSGAGLQRPNQASPNSSQENKKIHMNCGEYAPNKYMFPEIIKIPGKDSNNTDSCNDKQETYDKEKIEIQKYIRDKNAEIVVVLEGVDPMTSHNVQSYHSYVSNEIKWDHFFAPCTTVINGWTTVDFTKFHELRKASFNEGVVRNAPSHN